eukprot:scaffold1401_cov330-Pavlova_lutheri.AAC.139
MGAQSLETRGRASKRQAQIEGTEIPKHTQSHLCGKTAHFWFPIGKISRAVRSSANWRQFLQRGEIKQN